MDIDLKVKENVELKRGFLRFADRSSLATHPVKAPLGAFFYIFFAHSAHDDDQDLCHVSRSEKRLVLRPFPL